MPLYIHTTRGEEETSRIQGIFFSKKACKQMQWIAASLDGSPKDQGLLNIAFDAVCIYPVAFLPASLVVKFRKNTALDPQNLLGASVVILFHWS